MEISQTTEQGRVPVTIFWIKGEINAETADQFLAAVRHECHGGACDLLLDLSEVPYISSWGIKALSEVYSMLANDQGTQHPGTGKSAHLSCSTPPSRCSACGLGGTGHVPRNLHGSEESSGFVLMV